MRVLRVAITRSSYDDKRAAVRDEAKRGGQLPGRKVVRHDHPGQDRRAQSRQRGVQDDVQMGRDAVPPGRGRPAAA